jgi:phage-related protein
MELFTSDRYAANVLPNTFVKIIPNKKHAPQIFQIYRVREEGNKLSVSGYHIKYLATNNMISGYNRYFNSGSSDGRKLVVPPTKQDTAKNILQWLKDERFLLIEDYTDYAEDDAVDIVPYANQKHFTISSDIDNVVRTVRLREFTGEKIGNFLTDKENGMGQFGGEWLYDNFDLILKKKRGKAEAVKLRYGYELKSVVIEYSSDNNYNFVYPFAKVKPNSGVEFFLGIEPLVLKGDEIHKFPRLKTVDVSEHVPELEVDTSDGDSVVDAVDEIERAFSSPYYKNKYHARGYEIAVTAELNYSSRTVQDLELYDPVVLVTENGREITSKVNGITFDALEEKIVKVELDNKPLTLHDLLEGKRR